MKKKLAVTAVILLSAVSYSPSQLWANSDKYEEREHGEEHEEEYENEDEYEEERQEMPAPAPSRAEYWYQWSRSAAAPQSVETLPISQNGPFGIQEAGKERVVLPVIPREGQLFVPIQEMSAYLQAQATLYPNSGIVEVKKGTRMFVVRSGSKVIYENGRKTPMPAAVFEQDGKLYIPLAVLANTLGFTIAPSVGQETIQVRGEQVEA
ncbi:copper amine oxidase N-terminal domain-containing protein [Ectobacillus ponti]|uniref:Copper amine oxidase N-terminal domain-containing protein n=1 Tax=Ectobacillus ponti TaxID=2961894 RepID=A0AA42BRE5_9BACI|nr:copper amine oxidase N-terminal domain-containing protein [Ectobacillus ponti]MCP8971305.1 copper amine oxidase N-terminal domain-containing protein [Ectobacillus ponti]